MNKLIIFLLLVMCMSSCSIGAKLSINASPVHAQTSVRGSVKRYDGNTGYLRYEFNTTLITKEGLVHKHRADTVYSYRLYTKKYDKTKKH